MGALDINNYPNADNRKHGYNVFLSHPRTDREILQSVHMSAQSTGS